MIQTPDEIAQMFSIFHDGDIARFSIESLNLDLDVEIPYLTHRIQPGFECFHVCLLRFRELSFSTWQKDTGVEPWILKGVEEILGAEQEILSAEAEGATIKVVCNQPNPALSYCGGELRFAADGAIVTDQADREWSLSDLITLANEYWDEWSKH